MKIGLVSMPLSGHLNPMTALARKLQARGHEVVFIGVPDVERSALAAGLSFEPFCEEEYPIGSIAKQWEGVSKLHGLDVVRYSARRLMPGLTEAALEHLPEKLVDLDIQAVVLDTVYFFLELAAMRLGVPYVHIWNVLHLDLTAATPAFFFSWPHVSGREGLARNMEGLKAAGEILAPIRAIAKPYAEKYCLQIDWNDPTATRSKLAVITQMPKEFDLPDTQWPAHFHYAGPFHDDYGREPIPFPWERLTGQPLIYASLGTLVNGLDHVYRAILGAAARFPEMQLVLSIGAAIDPGNLGAFPSNVIVVRKAPQIELLKRAALCITRAGLNTTLESLAQGVPMVAIPIGYDQPGLAARIAYHGVGEFIEVTDLTVERLSNLIDKVRNNPTYGRNARSMQKVIAETNGLDVAADVIEESLGVGKAATVAWENLVLAHA